MDNSIEKIIGENDIKLDLNCNHIFKQVGFWDGENIGGPKLRCVKCKGNKYSHYGEDTYTDWRGKNISI
jgi:hypothetical protein